MKLRPPFLPLALVSLALGTILACNLFSGPAPSKPATAPTSPVGDFQETTSPSTGTPLPAVSSPTPVDVTSLPSVSSMGRLSGTQGWLRLEERLLWTDDGGSTWRHITPAAYPICLESDGCSQDTFDPFFLDASQAWLPLVQGREEAPPTTLYVLHTLDGGGNWTPYTVAEFPEPLFCPGPSCISGVDIHFVDPQNGWLAAYAPLGNIADLRFLYRTRDGGKTWSSLSIPVVGQITFTDPLNGLANGGETRWRSEQFLRTRDGGESWEPVSLDIPVAYAGPAGPEYQEPVFLSLQTGVLPVRFFNNESVNTALGFYTTRNGGGTWALAGTLEDPDLANTGPGIPIPWSAIDESTWFVAISETKQYLTRDEGQTWETFPAGGLGGAKLIDIQFDSEADGWGLGQICDSRQPGCSQPMFVTHDGGQNWRPIPITP